MSLGPPFDDSGADLQRSVGAAAAIALALAVGTMLYLSGRTIGRGGIIHVRLSTTGLLRDGAKVRVAGREIGEVRGISHSDPNTSHDIEVHAFIERDWLTQVPQDSQFFVSTPSVLGEAYLEIGAPPPAKQAGAMLTDGAHVRGVDPPDIDRFFEYSERNLRLVLDLLKESRPEFDELLKAVDSLLGTLSGIGGGELVRIAHQLEQCLDHSRALLASLHDAGGATRMQQIGHELMALVEHTAPELRALGDRVDMAMLNLAGLENFASPERRAELDSALQRFKKVITLSQSILSEAQALVAYVDRGKGNVGGFLHDRELYDDLHETHRILKSQPWSLILKSDKPRPVTPAR